MKVPSGSLDLPECSFLSLPTLNDASANCPSRWLRTRNVFERALTALVPTPLRPTLNWNTSSLYFAPVLILETQSTTLPSGMPRPKSRTLHARALDLDLDLLAVAHDEFVDRVVHDLLEQDVAAVVGMRAVADAPDVHARAQPDVLQRGQRLDLALVVIVLCVFSHTN